MADDGPYQYLTDNGVIVTDTSDLKTGVQGEWTDAFGADLIVGQDETPQGVLIVGETTARSATVRNNAALANQINPNYSGGVFLKALMALTGVDAPAATYSVIPTVTITGQPNAPVVAGAQARTDAGDIFQSITAVNFDATGTAQVDFQALVAGPVPCPVGALTTIVTDVLGWETVTNTIAATLGQVELSDEALRRLRNNSLAAQGSTLAESITSAIALVPGVRSQKFRENKTAVATVIDGINMVASSVWSCVDGGADADVAFALLSSKSGGCDWNGANAVEVVEPASGQNYTVKFDRPTPVPVLVRVTARAPTSAVTPADTITQAVNDYANGEVEGQDGFVVGGSVSPFDIAGAVMSELPGVYVKVLEVAPQSTGVYQTMEIAIALNQIATVAQVVVVLV